MPSYGFFRDDEVRDRSGGRQGGRTFSCVSCGLYKSARTPYMRPHGKGRRRIAVIGEGPGKDEDRAGKPWQGRAGRRLQITMKELGIDLFSDCVCFNSVNCRPPKNRTPTSYEIACCRRKIVNPAIKEHSPHVIILLGGPAVESVIGQQWTKKLGSVSRWRGWTIPDRKFNSWLCPTFHSSYVERESDRLEIETVWKQDLKRAIEKCDEPLPDLPDVKSQVVLLTKDDDTETVLRRIVRLEEGDVIAFDYETTGIKPQSEGHRIVCAAVTTKVATYAFPWPKSDRVLRLWRRLLRSESIGKIAQNFKFEHIWSKVRADVEVRNWVWDTMLASHVLDNRPGITGLKFQAYVQFGVIGYDDAIEPYLKGLDEKDANSKNRIDEFVSKFGIEEALLYCGIDSHLTFRLARLQMDQMGVKL